MHDPVGEWRRLQPQRTVECCDCLTLRFMGRAPPAAAAENSAGVVSALAGVARNPFVMPGVRADQRRVFPWARANADQSLAPAVLGREIVLSDRCGQVMHGTFRSNDSLNPTPIRVRGEIQRIGGAG